MTQCNHEALSFSNCRKRQVRWNFFGGSISSNGGALLLREVDRYLGLCARVARRLGDLRQRGKVRHEVETMVRQRMLAVALGHEDLNDHDALRHDLVVQTACGRDEELASASTLCRFERRAERQWAIAIHQELVEQFIASFAQPPRELVLDFDATDDPVHGHQPGRFFHGYYDRYCFLPLYVFCGQQLLVAYLRRSDIDASKHAWAILSLLVKRLRQAWPSVRIVVRGDSGFCRHRMLDWCDRNDVGYVVGLARNAVLEREVEVACEVARKSFRATGTKSRVFAEFDYAARTWRRTRWVIARIEHGPKGRNPRFIVTNLDRDAKELYERVYCARGDMENRIKEQQLALFADRTSSTKWWTNQFRVLLAALAYTVLETMRRTALRGTDLARAQCQTLRLRLLKIGAVVTRNTRTVQVRLSSAYPDQAVFRLLVQRLTAG